jgi:DNA repair photolyase
MIRPGVAAPSLRARIGNDVVARRGEVRYRELRAASLVNRCSTERMPFEWTVNPYRGCAMGCRYCYAAYTHEYLGLPGDESFHTTVFVKTGGLANAARRLAAAARRGQLVALGTATDPYQPGEAQARVTRRFLEAAVQVRGLRLAITTKGAVVLRDIDLLRRLHGQGSLTISVSLNSLDAALLRRTEPLAPPPETRLVVVRRLAEAGLDVGLGVAPLLPALTDDEAALDRLLAAAQRAGARRAALVPLFLRSPTREKYLGWLAREFPRHLEAYERAYARGAYLDGPYRRRLDAMFDRLVARHGLARDWERRAPADPEQLGLFASR